jgi:exodeoxyribonuclease VIII
MNTTETINDYHANAALSHSKLETFRRRPALFYKKYVEKSLAPVEPSSAFRIGSAAHVAILEPDQYYERYARRPDGIDRRTKEGKAAFAEFEAANLGKIIIDGDEDDQAGCMERAVRDHPLASQLLDDGVAEATWRTGGSMPLQCRTDWFNPKGCELSQGRPYVADLKTVESLDADAFRNFERACFSFGYHRQAGFYLPLISEITTSPVFDFFFIAIEKVEPFGCAVYRLSDEAVSIGQDESIQDLRGIKACVDSGVWPNIEIKLHDLGLPKWYAKNAI